MNTLLIIDAQNDFVLPDGALPVAGAVKDMAQLVDFIATTPLDRVVLTMDSHRKGHIATASYWTDQNGNAPAPFTQISYADAKAGLWKSPNEGAVEYLRALEAHGKRHTIWPEHCIYGETGWKLYQPIADVLQRRLLGGQVSIHLKGEKLDTEMFSVIMPEVAQDEDLLNAERILSLLDGSDKLYIAGEAENFCVKETVRDIAKMRPDLVPKIVILRSCMSVIPVPGDDIEAFWDKMKAQGVSLLSS